MLFIHAENKFTWFFEKSVCEASQIMGFKEIQTRFTSSEIASTQIDKAKTVTIPFIGIESKSKLIYTIGNGEDYIHW